MSNLSYCANQVRLFDRERFLCALFMPESKREMLFTLYAFHIEISRIQTIVTEPMAGLLRLQWWRDNIEQIYNGAIPNHPVCEPLAVLINEKSLPKGYFDNILNARALDFETEPFATIEHLSSYAENIYSSILHLCAKTYAVEQQLEKIPVKALSTAFACMELLRLYQKRPNQCIFPTNMVVKSKLTVDDTINIEDGEIIKPLVKQYVLLMEDFVASVKNSSTMIPAEIFPLFLPLVFIEKHIRILKKYDYNIFNSNFQERRLRSFLQLLKSGFKKKL